MANEVIGSAEFGMEDTYADIFQHGYDSKELLFTRFMKNPPAMDDVFLNSGRTLDGEDVARRD